MNRLNKALHTKIIDPAPALGATSSALRHEAPVETEMPKLRTFCCCFTYKLSFEGSWDLKLTSINYFQLLTLLGYTIMFIKSTFLQNLYFYFQDKVNIKLLEKNIYVGYMHTCTVYFHRGTKNRWGCRVKFLSLHCQLVKVV